MSNHLDHILAPLNTTQRQAVTAPVNQSVLVLAGAGSGKTRVLTHRIAWLIFEAGFNPYQILAVTFTNKAAREMLSRVETLLNGPAKGMWVGTFHGTCHRLLRLYHQEAGLREDFQIIDQDDQLRLIKRIHKDFGLDETQWPSKSTQHFINQQKDAGVRAKSINLDEAGPRLEQLKIIYQHYEALCQQSGLVDFSELLLAAFEMLQTNEDVLRECQQRFQYVLIDEFQDTNRLQYAWVRLLCQGRNTITVVGDDDQSIYSWRGAMVDHILSFANDYSDTLTVRLEQNYRSTQTILDAANAVISHNQSRLGKALWSEGDRGEAITVYAAFNETDEAHVVAQQVRDWLSEGIPAHEIALLYRSNAQSRQLEDKLLLHEIHYRVYGGLRFFDRAEVRDGLAYVRLLVNPQDNAAFLRVINLPARGIGEKTIEKLSQHARQRQISLWQATEHALSASMISGKVAKTLAAWQAMINDCRQSLTKTPPLEACLQLWESSGLWEFYGRQLTTTGGCKRDNLEELLNSIENNLTSESSDPTTNTNEPSAAHHNLGLLASFINQVSLDNRAEDTTQDAVQLMTLHAAKGLEFKAVVICGLEEGLFPHSMCLDQSESIEEERRLCYVGMTRARERLMLTHALQRRLHGKESYQRPSRFLRELPEAQTSHLSQTSYPWHQQHHNVTRGTSSFDMTTKQSDSHSLWSKPMASATTTPSTEGPYALGATVSHARFGIGTILNVEYHQQTPQRVQVKFDSGVKWLAVAYAKLEPVA